MSTFWIVLVMALGGGLGYVLWAVVVAAIARTGKKRKEQLARRGLPIEVDSGRRR
jgi:hypothetical protein